MNKLTKEQLEGIFTGKIKNWKEVGGEDLKIVPYARETSSVRPMNFLKNMY